MMLTRRILRCDRKDCPQKIELELPETGWLKNINEAGWTMWTAFWGTNYFYCPSHMAGENSGEKRNG